MILRVVVLSLLLVSALLVEAVVAPALSVFGVPPDLTVLAVVGLALDDGPSSGSRFGFAAGFARDLLASTSALMGPWTLALLLVGYLTGALRAVAPWSELTSQAIVGAGAAFTAWLVAGLLNVVLSTGAASIVDALLHALVAGGWGLVLAPVVSRLVQLVSARTAPAAPPSG